MKLAPEYWDIWFWDRKRKESEAFGCIWMLGVRLNRFAIVEFAGLLKALSKFLQNYFFKNNLQFSYNNPIKWKEVYIDLVKLGGDAKIC